MTVSYEWQIEQLDTAPLENGMTDVVHRVHWRLWADDGESRADLYGELVLPSPSPSAFTPYEDLTKGDVEQWVEATIDARAAEEGSDESSVAMLRESLAGVLAARRTPSIVAKPLPW